MKYKSTRGGESGVSFERALLSAYATDGGLYVPEHLPCLTEAQLRAWSSFSFPMVCAEVLQLFADLPIAKCREMTSLAFAGWNGGGDNPPLPLRRVPMPLRGADADGAAAGPGAGDGAAGGAGDDSLLLLETGEGPTFAFKDIGQQIVAQLLNHYLGARGRHAPALQWDLGA